MGFNWPKKTSVYSSLPVVIRPVCGLIDTAHVREKGFYWSATLNLIRACSVVGVIEAELADQSGRYGRMGHEHTPSPAGSSSSAFFSAPHQSGFLSHTQTLLSHTRHKALSSNVPGRRMTLIQQILKIRRKLLLSRGLP